MANKRVSELAPLTAQTLDHADLLLVADISAHESKKVNLEELSNFLLLDLTGSLHGSASYANMAGTASYAMNVSSPTTVPTASYLRYVPNTSNGTASYAVQAATASTALNSTHALTASFALTASVQTTTAFANFAQTSSFLQYTGQANGTASYALTASYFGGNTTSVASASYANSSSLAISASHSNISDYAISTGTASVATTATFLQYSENNGTASYAMSAGGFGPILRNYGMFAVGNTGSYYCDIEYVSITPSSGIDAETQYECVGTAIMNLSESLTAGGRISLYARNRTNGVSTELDHATISYNFPVSSSTSISGSINVPFTLMGDTSTSNDYTLYLTSSSPTLTFNNNRITKIKISSFSDQVAVAGDYEPSTFEVVPSLSMFQITSSGGNLIGMESNVASIGYDQIISLNMSGSSITDIRYPWSLTNLVNMNCSHNPSLTALQFGFGQSLLTLDCSHCALSSITNLDNTGLLHFSCSANNMFSFPTLPTSIIAVYGDSNNIGNVDNLPDNVGTMSLASNQSTLAFNSFPANLVWCSCANTSVATLPTMPVSCSNLNFNACGITSDMIDTLCSDLVSNGQFNGRLDVRNNVVPSSTAFGYMVTLSSRGWTVLHD